MVSTTSLFAATVVAVAGCLTTYVQAHGYMYLPEAVPLANHKNDKMLSSWIVQIDPQFDADWNSVSDDTALVALYTEKAKAGGYENNLRKLLDDTNVYGADCGYSDPKASPKNPPTDGTATFSRGIAHHGPCEIWLDDKMVLDNDDCEKAFGTSDYEKIKTVFKPIDYSSCSASGCMLRFYWLAFQASTTGKSSYVWQIYKSCVPLTGPAAGQTSTASTTSNSTQPTDSTSNNSGTPTAGSPSTPSPNGQNQRKPTSENTSTNTPQATQAPMAPNSAGQPPSVTNTSVPANAPAPQAPATVAPFNQAHTTQNPVWTSTNSPNSYSFNGGNQPTNTPPSTTTVPSFSF